VAELVDHPRGGFEDGQSILLGNPSGNRGVANSEPSCTWVLPGPLAENDQGWSVLFAHEYDLQESERTREGSLGKRELALAEVV
jgi:hypothetical protein